MALISRGVGKPDFSNVPMRPEVEPTRQMAWSITYGPVALPPLYTLEVTLYTVPVSHRLVLGFGAASANHDIIGVGWMLIDGVPRIPTYTGSSPIHTVLTDASALQLESGTTIGVHVENPLNCAILAAGDFSGFLYDTG